VYTYEIADDEYVTSTREVTEGSGYGSVPVYQLHYAVFYNASAGSAAAAAEESYTSFTVLPTSTIVPDDDDGDQKASNVCARHYAETFLIRLFTLQTWLNNLCGEQRQLRPRVVIHTIVVVRVYGPLVCICDC